MADQGGRDSRFQLLAAAVVFAGALFVGFQLASGNPDYEASNGAWSAYWAVRSHRVEAIVSGYSLLLAAAGLVWFTTSLARRVGSRVVELGGWAAAVLIAVGAIGWMAVPTVRSLDGAPAPAAGVMRVSIEIGSEALGVVGAPLIGSLIVAACVAARRSRTLSAWVVWAGFALGVLGGVGGAAMMPMLLLPVWVLLAGATVAFGRARTRRVAAVAA
jgi:hypothetical protein